MSDSQAPSIGDAIGSAPWSAQLYRQLRTLAHARLRDGGRDALLDTTALVHEAFLRMGTLRVAADDLDQRRRLLAFASQTMRSVIVDSARARQAEKRGGDACIVTLTGSAMTDERGTAAADHIVRVHDALLELETLDARLARVVEMRFFGGFDDDEIALALEQSPRTVRRDWDKARRILAQALRD